MPRHRFTREEQQRGGRATAAKVIPPTSCPCGCGLEFTRHILLAAHLGMNAFANKYCKGDKRLARWVLTQMGIASLDPFPENGAFAEAHRVLAEIRAQIRTEKEKVASGKLAAGGAP